MILHRFCSRAEYDGFKAGVTLKNDTDHFKGGSGGSLSRGFCFFDGDVIQWARRLNGLVSFDVMITVEVDEKLVHRSSGVYIDWSKDNFTSVPPRALFQEYYTTSYNNRDFRLVVEDFSFNDHPWFKSKPLQRDIF